MRAAIVVLVGLLAYPFSAHAADCSSQVSAAFAKLRSSKAFRLETKITNAQGKLYMTVDYVTPDRMYQRIRLDEQPTEMELIVVGHDAWSNQGQGWAKLPENFASAVSAQVRNTLLGGQHGGLSYECGGEEVVDGRRVAVFRADLPPAGEKERPEPEGERPTPANVQTLHIDQATGLPVRNVVTDGRDPNKRLFDGSLSTVDDITIEPPAAER